MPGALHNLDTALYGGGDLADCNKWSALKCARAKAPQALFQDDEPYPADEPDSAVRALENKPAPFVKKGPKVSAKSFFETKSSKSSKASKKKTTPMKQLGFPPPRRSR